MELVVDLDLGVDLDVEGVSGVNEVVNLDLVVYVHVVGDVHRTTKR